MAKSVNKVFLLGNVGKDPEIRSTGGGTMVANFRLATSDRSKDPQGNWQDRTEWHNLVAFKRTAEIVRDYVKKGRSFLSKAGFRPAVGKTRTPRPSATAPKSSSTISRCSQGATIQGRRRLQPFVEHFECAVNEDQRAPAAQDDYSQSAEISDDDIPF